MQDRTLVVGKKARLPTAKEKGKAVSKPLDLDDSSDSDAPFSTRESGSSDEEEEEDEEDGEEEPKGGKASLSLQPSRLSSFHFAPHSLP
jgi:hypothetical protein